MPRTSRREEPDAEARLPVMRRPVAASDGDEAVDEGAVATGRAGGVSCPTFSSAATEGHVVVSSPVPADGTIWLLAGTARTALMSPPPAMSAAGGAAPEPPPTAGAEPAPAAELLGSGSGLVNPPAGVSAALAKPMVRVMVP